MNLSEDQLKEIEEMAGLFFSIEDITDNLQLDDEALQEIQNEVELKQGTFYLAYRSGWLRSEVKLRRSIEKAAENGSNPAQQMMLNFQKSAIK